MIRGFFFLIAFVAGRLLIGDAIGQEKPSFDQAYVKVTEDRAEKIVQTLKIDDGELASRVKSLIAKQYQDLHDIHASRDEMLNRVKENTNGLSELERSNQAERFKLESNEKQYRLHFAFLSKLAAELNHEQIDKIKDGLTYNVLPNTYQYYLELYPALNAEQKRVLLSMLIEAREHAIDGGSSDEKHAWFGKYKGRINNYLSSAGFDAKEAERLLKEKKKAK